MMQWEPNKEICESMEKAKAEMTRLDPVEIAVFSMALLGLIVDGLKHISGQLEEICKEIPKNRHPYG